MSAVYWNDIIPNGGQNGGNIAFLSDIIVLAYFYDWKTILFIL